METNDLITILMGIGVIVLVVFIAIAGVIYSFNKGSIDRFWSNLNKDTATARDEVYQTGNVRIYKFVDDGNVCYLADKQSLSTSIYCVKEIK